MTIKKQAQCNEIEYYIFLSKYAEITNEQVQALFSKGALTLIVLLSRINQMFIYDRIMSFYLSHANIPDRIHEMVTKLFYRCLLT